MNLQFIHDNKGNTTGVFIPIEEWQSLKDKYADLDIEEANQPDELSDWEKNLIDERLKDYFENPTDVRDIHETIRDIEKTL